MKLFRPSYLWLALFAILSSFLLASAPLSYASIRSSEMTRQAMAEENDARAVAKLEGLARQIAQISPQPAGPIPLPAKAR